MTDSFSAIRPRQRGGVKLRNAQLGPGKDGSAAAWKSWWLENKPYLFFGDSGGYRWYIDPLATKRPIATADLRGPARADVVKPKGRPRGKS
ncbi:MAG TPA: hypothetical protein VHC22_29510 [Pirellulales bacterium]|nr:hypothetical protein [Pirellulales bacterium]